MDVKGENPKAQPSTLKIVALKCEKFTIWKSDFSSKKGPPKLNRGKKDAVVFCKRTVMAIHEKLMNMSMC